MDPISNHALIGFGNIARALYPALKHEPSLQFAYFTRSPKNAPLREFTSLAEIVVFADTIQLCVKPQDLPEVLQQLRSMDLTI